MTIHPAGDFSIHPDVWLSTPATDFDRRYTKYFTNSNWRSIHLKGQNMASLFTEMATQIQLHEWETHDWLEYDCEVYKDGEDHILVLRARKTTFHRKNKETT